MEKKYTISTEYIFKVDMGYEENDTMQFMISVTEKNKVLFIIYISYPNIKLEPFNYDAYYKYIAEYNLRIHMYNHMILEFEDCTIFKDIFNDVENMCKELHELSEDYINQNNLNFKNYIFKEIKNEE